MRRRGGFTLIEVLVALAVMAIGLLAVAKMTYMSVRSNIRNQQAGSGVVAAKSKMEQLRGYARSDRADRFSPLDFDYLVSRQANFASLLKPGTPPTDFVIDGMLSGGRGRPRPPPGTRTSSSTSSTTTAPTATRSRATTSTPTRTPPPSSPRAWRNPSGSCASGRSSPWWTRSPGRPTSRGSP